MKIITTRIINIFNKTIRERKITKAVNTLERAPKEDCCAFFQSIGRTEVPKNSANIANKTGNDKLSEKLVQLQEAYGDANFYSLVQDHEKAKLAKSLAEKVAELKKTKGCKEA